MLSSYGSTKLSDEEIELILARELQVARNNIDLEEEEEIDDSMSTNSNHQEETPQDQFEQEMIKLSKERDIEIMNYLQIEPVGYEPNLPLKSESVNLKDPSTATSSSTVFAKIWDKFKRIHKDIKAKIGSDRNVQKIQEIKFVQCESFVPTFPDNEDESMEKLEFQRMQRIKELDLSIKQEKETQARQEIESSMVMGQESIQEKGNSSPTSDGFNLMQMQHSIKMMQLELHELKFKRDLLRERVLHKRKILEERKLNFINSREIEKDAISQNRRIIMEKITNKTTMFHEESNKLKNQIIPILSKELETVKHDWNKQVIKLSETTRRFSLLKNDLEDIRHSVSSLTEQGFILAAKVDEKRQFKLQESERQRLHNEKRKILWEKFKNCIGLDPTASEDVLWMLHIYHFKDTHMLDINEYFSIFPLLRNAKILTLDSVQGDQSLCLSGTSENIATDTDIHYIRCKKMKFVSNYPVTKILHLTDCTISDYSLREKNDILIVNGSRVDHVSQLSCRAVILQNCWIQSFDFSLLGRSLVFLDLSGNQLKSFNADLRGSPIRQVILKNNRIQGSIKLYSHTMTSLDISRNSLEDLEFTGLTPSLQNLDVSMNKISKISNLSACPFLSVLNLSDNNINDVTILLHVLNLCFLTELSLFSNPISMSPGLQELVTFGNPTLSIFNGRSVKGIMIQSGKYLSIFRYYNLVKDCLDLDPNEPELPKTVPVSLPASEIALPFMAEYGYNNLTNYAIESISKTIESLQSALHESKLLEDASSKIFSSEKDLLGFSRGKSMVNGIKSLAVTRITSFYRGYRIRQVYQEMKRRLISLQIRWRYILRNRKISRLQKEYAEAASKIQARFRGHRTRKVLSTVKIRQTPMDYLDEDDYYDVDGEEGAKGDGKEFSTWIMEKLTSVEDFEKQIDHFIQSFEVEPFQPNYVEKPKNTLAPIINRQFELLQDPTLISLRESLKVKIEPVPSKPNIEPKPRKPGNQEIHNDGKNIDNGWNLKSESTLAWMRKREAKMKNIEKQSKNRELRKDPMKRLESFEANTKKGNSKMMLEPLPDRTRKKAFNLPDKLLIPDEDSSSRSTSVLSQRSLARAPIKLFNLNNLLEK